MRSGLRGGVVRSFLLAAFVACSLPDQGDIDEGVEQCKAEIRGAISPLLDAIVAALEARVGERIGDIITACRAAQEVCK